MALKNHTPLPCLPFEAMVPDGDPITVVILRTTLELVPVDRNLHAEGWTHDLKLGEEQLPLAVSDTFNGAFARSSVRWESDTASPKPRCDVLVLGTAYAPGGRPGRRFQVRLRITAEDAARPVPRRLTHRDLGRIPSWEEDRRYQQEVAWAQTHPVPGEVILDKVLQITGERWLKRRNLLSRAVWWFLKVGTLGLIRRCPWRLSSPKPATSVPLVYEYAYGGHVQVKASDRGSWRLSRRDCAPGVDKDEVRRAWKKSRVDGLLAERWWAGNPVGRAYAPLWYLKATGTWRLPAPQIEDPEHPFTAKAAWKAMLGKAAGRYRLPLMPQGMGVVTRTWEPRVKHAGSWDAAWQRSGSPYPPDYSPAFDNCAPLDQQCRHLEGNEVVELTNLCPAGRPGGWRDGDGNQWLRFKLPDLYPFLLLVHDTGETEQVPAVLDTLILEPDRGRVTLIHRASFPRAREPEELELRLAMPGEPREVPLANGKEEDEPEWQEEDLVE